MILNGDTSQAQAKASHLKVALSIKLIDQINWINGLDFQSFKLGVYGEDTEVIDSFKLISKNQKVKRRRLNIQVIDDLNRLNNINALYLCQDKVHLIHEIYTVLKNKEILFNNGSMPRS